MKAGLGREASGADTAVGTMFVLWVRPALMEAKISTEPAGEAEEG